METLKVGTFCSLFMNMVATAFRYYLCKYFSQLQNTARRLNTLKFFSDKKTEFQIIWWLVVSFGVYLSLFVFAIFTSINKTEDNNYSQMMFGYKPKHATTEIRVYCIYIFFYTLTLLMPLNTFTIFYVSVCLNICEALKSYKNSMTSNSLPKFKRLLGNYLVLRKGILETDKDLSFLVFFVILMNASSLLFMYYFTVSQNFYKSLEGRAPLFIIALNNMISFLAVCSAASEVSKAATEIAEESKYLPENDIESNFTHLLFLLNTNKETSMTVLGIPINTSFALVCLGTILTYLILLSGITDIH